MLTFILFHCFCTFRQVFYVEMACNSMFGAAGGLIDPPNPDLTYNLSTAEIRVFNRRAYGLLMDVETLYDMAKVQLVCDTSSQTWS